MKKALFVLLLLPFVALSETTNAAPNSIVTTAPAAALSGNYTVGTNGNFTTLTAAVAALNANGVSGAVTFTLTNATYSVAKGEVFPLTINAVNGSSATNKITFKPATGVNATIDATNQTINWNLAPVSAVFVLKGTDYVTIDGSNTANGTSKNLTLINNNNVYEGSDRAVVWVANSNGDAATYITVKNTILKGLKNAASSFNGGVYSGTYATGGSYNAHINLTESNVNNTALTVVNNLFQDVKQGVYVNAGSGVAKATNVTVANNNFGTYSSSNGQRLHAGVLLKNVVDFTVTENAIHDIQQEFSTWDSNVAMMGGGIYVGGASKNGSVTNNNIKDLVRTTDNSYQLAGVALESSEASANILVANNFILNIKTNSYNGDSAQGPQGISVKTGGNYKIYFNTVNLTDNQTVGGYSTAFYVGANAGTALDVRNNIFANNQTNSGTRRTAVRIVKAQNQVSSTFTYLNYNNLYGSFIGYLGTNPNTGDNAGYQTSKSGWQSVLSGFEANAVNVTPAFVSASDLHLTQNNAVNATLVGTPVAGITKDIDGNLRSFTTPAIGADEYGVSPYAESVTCDNSTIWDGTSWSNGVPTATTNAIIKGNFTQSAGTLTACTLFVLNGATANFINNSTAKIIHSVNVETTGSLTFESSSVLIQVENDANTGIATIKRNSSKLKRLDYTIWSAPVTDNRATGFQTLRQFSQMTSVGRFYTYKTSEGLFFPVDENTTKFSAAAGFLIRMPNSTESAAYNAGTERIQYNGVFTGTPNNGTVTKELNYTDANHGYNMVGNPYPSPLSVTDFINANINNIDGTVWLWRKNNNSTQSSYCTANLSGFVANKAPGGNSTDGNDLLVDPFLVDARGSLNTAQGFFVKANNANAQIVFNNSMRLQNHSASFFKSAAPAVTEEPSDVSRLWLNVTNAAGDFDQTLIAYNAATTLGYDNGYDGKSISAGSLSLYSIATVQNDTLNLAIQARGTFNAQDVVKMGYTATVAGTYTINIDHSEGVFANGQVAYITDNVEGITRNLTDNNYTFTTEAGTFDNRFTVKYATTALGTDTPELAATDVIVYKNNKQVGVTAPKTIKSVVVYDMLGRSLYNNAKVNSVDFKTSEINTAQQVVIVNVTLENNQVVTKKIMMN